MNPRLSAAPVREVPLDAPGSLVEARDAVAARFAAEVGKLDVVLLGCGPDGHVASLFPGHPALDEPGPVIAVPDSPKPSGSPCRCRCSATWTRRCWSRPGRRRHRC